MDFIKIHRNITEAKTGENRRYQQTIKNKNMNATVSVTTVTQTANETLGTTEKKLYYLIIENENGKEIINVGQKTHDKVLALTTKKGGKK